MKINDRPALDTWPRIPPMDQEMYAIGGPHTIAVRPDGDKWRAGIIMAGGTRFAERLKWAEVGEWAEDQGVDLTIIAEFIPSKGYTSLFDVYDGKPDQSPKVDKSRYVYFIQCGKTGPIKIGYANDVKARLATLQTASPFDLRLLATIKGRPSLERQLHNRFAGDRLRGEWFLPTSELLAFVSEVAA